MAPDYSTLDQGYDHHVKDKWGREYHFKILSFSLGSRLFSEAREVIHEKGREPYVFSVISDDAEEWDESENLLKHKILDGINKRFLKSEGGKLDIRDEGRLSGRIEWDQNVEDSVFELYFAIDGKRITMENFVRMLEPYCAFNFDFEIRDSSE